MAFVTPAKLREYDVIVVGSGAAGGQAAYTLTMAGARVLMLEAGRNYVPEKETPMFQTRGEAPLRASSTPDKPFGFHDATIDGGWLVPGEPYVNTTQEDSGRFYWWRSRMLGGRTNHWGRYAFRNGPYDFKPRSRDGLGFDWPLVYEELAPYYDKVEMLIGVYGRSDGLENTPDSPPGCLLPPPKPRVSDLLIADRSRKLGIPVVAGHRAVLTHALDHRTLPAKLHPGNPTAQKILAEHMRGRAACFWATPCGRGCSIRATYQSTTVHLPPALATGKLDILVDAMVREVTLDGKGRASGVSYVDKKTGRSHHAVARAVVLGASACETVRILLNSKSARFPQGLANSSGKLGRYLMDTVGSSVDGQIPLLEGLPPHNEDGASGGHMYAPWWMYKEQLAGKLGFARGYHVEFGGGRGMPSVDTVAGIEWLTGGSYGRKFREDARRYYGSFVWFNGRGEMVPNEDSYCELDPEVKDRWGIPVLRFHWKWSEHELNQARHHNQTFVEIIEKMGGKVTSAIPDRNADHGLKVGGEIIHEAGCTRMGDSPRTSVLNKWCQAHDAKNVFVADSGPFVSNAHKNMTWTILALSMRTSEHIAEERNKGNL